MGGVQLEGLPLQKVVEVLRQAIKEKIGEPLSLRFRRCTSNTARKTTEVSQTETRKESGVISRKKQKDLVSVSDSKERVAQSAIPSLDAKPGRRKDTNSTSEIVKDAEKPAAKHAVRRYLDAKGLRDGHEEYEAVVNPDKKFGIGLRLSSKDSQTVYVGGFRKHPGE